MSTYRLIIMELREKLRGTNFMSVALVTKDFENALQLHSKILGSEGVYL